MKYTDADIDKLRRDVAAYLTEKRYRHTLAVEGEAAYMAALYMPERENELRAAALLHDIAKKLSYENQLNYIREFDIMIGEKDPVGDVAHAPAGAAMIKAHFPAFDDPDIISAVRYHSTGRAYMTVFEAIIFLADYIEPTRSHESCRALREKFHREADAAKTMDERLGALCRAVVDAMRSTVYYVRSSGMELDPETLTALSYFEAGGVLRDSV